MLPLLKFAVDGKEHSVREAIEHLAEVFKLDDDERKALLPSGKQAIFENRVGWARTYMKNAGLLEATRRSFFRITPRGIEALQQNPTEINKKFLERYADFVRFLEASRKPRSPITGLDRNGESETETAATPEEALEEAYQRIRQSLAQELLAKVKASSPPFFERLVVELLVKMGYGGSRRDAGEAVGRTGDEGIDGIIKEDRLGLDVIYIQAKKWEASVGRPEIQKFVGALQGQRARKGIFITTSGFTNDATEYASRIDNKIILVDGEQLAQLMIDHEVGVAKAGVYEVKKLDLDYFPDE